MEISDEQKLLLKNFREILVFGYSKLSSAEMDYKKLRLKKQLLFLIMGAVQSYSEAILKLLDPVPIYDKAAEVLLRSIIETLVNINYIYGDRTQTKAAIFMIYSLEDRIDFGEKFKNLKLKHPTWKLPFGPMTTIEDWDKFLLQNNSEIDLIEAKLKKKLRKKFPDLRPRAEQADSYLKGKHKLTERNSLEVNYVYYYKYFSQLTHLTMPGLESFFSRDEEGREVCNIDGKGDDAERVASVAYIAYFTILRFFLKEYALYNKVEYKKFKSLAKTISRNPNKSK